MHTALVVSAGREPTFVLVHSPLVGPTSWLPVARERERRRRAAVVPSLLGVAVAPEPRWRHVPDAVRIATSQLDQRIVLVGHSGAGPLLPVIADASDNEVAALVFVDSLPPPPAGRLLLGPPAFWSSCVRRRPMVCWRRGLPGSVRTRCANWCPTSSCARNLRPRCRACRSPTSKRRCLCRTIGRTGVPAVSAAERHRLRPERRRRARPRLAGDRDPGRPAPGNRHEPDPDHRRSARPRTSPGAIDPVGPTQLSDARRAKQHPASGG